MFHVYIVIVTHALEWEKMLDGHLEGRICYTFPVLNVREYIDTVLCILDLGYRHQARLG